MVLDIETWEQTFQELMQQEIPWAKWTLMLDRTLQPGCVARGWKQYQQRAFGRFRCSSCQRSWASAQVHVLFHTYWEDGRARGQVRVRLFAQRCQKCSWPQYEMPEFSPDSTTRILNNLVRHILERYYGGGIRKFPQMPVIAEVPLEGSHDSANCEACTLGFCVRGLQSRTREPCTSLLPYQGAGSSSSQSRAACVQNQARNQLAEAKKAPGSVRSFVFIGPRSSWGEGSEFIHGWGEGSGFSHGWGEGSGPSHGWDPLVIWVCIFLFAFFVGNCVRQNDFK
ncbi:PREDICTED: receptor-transporting protein 4 isoform X1 [Galeopterus variegatus]|uniref:Receptor-transporting protein 4 isoform X1 n=1 Tax=Galeopterus variegatus TaxID=482537 RepID=A0ABM0S9B1_GALVR|nr:PREDICTED: receptor-transporting protein 4 isoform X1 [Galeopterus variegatus]